MPGPHPPEFRRRAVELARELDDDGNRRYPIAQLARDLKISESCLRNWLAADQGRDRREARPDQGRAGGAGPPPSGEPGVADGA
jgi:transposase-like protein